MPVQETYEMRVWSLGWEDLLEKEMATHSSIPAWRIPREDRQAQSIASQSHTQLKRHSTRTLLWALHTSSPCAFSTCIVLLGKSSAQFSHFLVSSLVTQATLTVLQLKLCISIAFTCYFLKIILKFLDFKNFIIMSMESSTVCDITDFSRKEVSWQLSVQKF